MYEAWNRIKQHGSGWYLMAHHLRGGDLYHACSLIPHFKEVHGGGLPIFLILENDRQESIASMFAKYFDEILVAPGFPESFERWREFFAATGLGTFGPNTPVILHPQISQETNRFSTDFIDQNRHFGLTWMQLHKQVMHLPGTVEPVHPPRSSALAEQARQLCAEHAVPHGSAVILFPYAQSIPVESLDHFAHLARALEARGLEVFTSVALQERPVAGTRPITIPFALLQDVANYAGWIVAVRSGICDILSPVPCRKSFIYPNMRELRFWSVAALGLGRDANEFPFDFLTQSADQLVALVFNRRSFDRLPPIRDHLTRQIGQGQASVPVWTFSFTDLDGRPVEISPSTPRTGHTQSAIRLLDVPRRDHPRLADQVTASLTGFLKPLSGNEAQVYVCRDAFLSDLFEEVDTVALLNGSYSCANYWHSLVIVEGVTLLSLLPADLHRAVAVRETVAVGEPISLAEAFRASLALQGPDARPIVYRGLLLDDGWCDLEEWGIWTSGHRSVMKFLLPQRPTKPTRITIDCRACLSPSFTSTNLFIEAEGSLVATRTIDESTSLLQFELPTGSFSDRNCTLVFRFDEVRSPAQQGTGEDKRRLGLAIRWVRVDI